MSSFNKYLYIYVFIQRLDGCKNGNKETQDCVLQRDQDLKNTGPLDGLDKDQKGSGEPAHKAARSLHGNPVNVHHVPKKPNEPTETNTKMTQLENTPGIPEGDDDFDENTKGKYNCF